MTKRHGAGSSDYQVTCLVYSLCCSPHRPRLLPRVKFPDDVRAVHSQTTSGPGYSFSNISVPRLMTPVLFIFLFGLVSVSCLKSRSVLIERTGHQTIIWRKEPSLQIYTGMTLKWAPRQKQSRKTEITTRSSLASSYALFFPHHYAFSVRIYASPAFLS